MTQQGDDDREFDIRTIERRIDQDEVDREDYEAHLDDLPDVSDNAEPIEAEFEEGVLDDEAEGDDEDQTADEEEATEDASEETE